jgi:hypothetical protein
MSSRGHLSSPTPDITVKVNFIDCGALDFVSLKRG